MQQQLRPLSNALAKKAAAELNENTAEIEFYLNSLRDWVKNQRHFKSRSSDQFLVVFLRSSKWSLERAKQKLENFYLYRSRMAEIFKNRTEDSPKIMAIIKSGCLLHLPEPNGVDGPRVIMIRPNCFDMTKHSIPDVFKVGSLATDLLLYEDDNAIVAGYEVIMDLANIPAAVLLNFDPKFARKLTILANKISPTRMKGFHIINTPPMFEKLFNMVKSVINVKLKKRFYIHGNNYETLYQHIPHHILPKEYGGECDIASLQNGWVEKLNKFREFLKEEEDCFGILEDETFPCKSSSSSNTEFTKNYEFGANGSFRQLNLD